MRSILDSDLFVACMVLEALQAHEGARGTVPEIVRDLIVALACPCLKRRARFHADVSPPKLCRKPCAQKTRTSIACLGKCSLCSLAVTVQYSPCCR
ncbi:hypothetical protein BCV70DRAFT_90468 [Testicularia cyperi]|uniref:Uncharacterized protein n=1 Tax=Testicularia cyperi TaxID=1882483 RepID=A0A317XUU5_9BASI|nr:hypothetical protein BCV70DRAFT_90468 [Testicularia cyperi]